MLVFLSTRSPSPSERGEERPTRRNRSGRESSVADAALSGRARSRIGRDRRAAAGRALADLDPLLGDLSRQRVGPHAVNSDLIVIIAERKQRRGAGDEPVAAWPGLIGGAVHLADQFERGHHRPAHIGYPIDPVASWIC